MASIFVMGLNLQQTGEMERFHKTNLDLNTNVELLKDEVAKEFSQDKQQLELMYCGTILNDTQPLTQCGIKSGAIVHAIKKPQPKPIVPTPFTLPQFKAIIPKMGHEFFYFIKHHWTSDVIDQLITLIPELKHDPVSIAILKDNELLIEAMSNRATTIKTHPNVLRAIYAYVDTCGYKKTNVEIPANSRDYTAEDSEEEMDSGSDSNNGQSGNATPERPPITHAQLATAIASAWNAAQSSATPTAGTSRDVPIVQHALRRVISQLASSEQTSENAVESIEQISRRLAPQLQQMREMGLMNIVTNVQALQYTSGDVQAAIDLVFSGVLNEN